jgi:hypothetical protein
MNVKRLTRARRQKRWGGFGLLTALIALGLSLGPSGPYRARAADASGDEGGCSLALVRDFASPLHGLPKLRPLPESGELSSLPSGVRLEFLAPEVTAGPTKAGLSLEASDLADSVDANVSISASLGRVVGRSGSVRALATVRKRYRVISPRERSQLGAGGDLGPGVYRLLVAVRGPGGQVLGSYGQYFRVVKRSRHADLVAAPTSLKGGEPVSFHFENFGSLPLEFGLPYRIDRWSAGAWQPAADGPKGPWPEVLLAIGGGGAGGCSSWDIPSDAVPGTYRAVHRVSIGGRSRILTAVFRVGSGS